MEVVPGHPVMSHFFKKAQEVFYEESGNYYGGSGYSVTFRVYAGHAGC